MANTGKRIKKAGDRDGILTLLKETQARQGYITPDTISSLASSIKLPLHEVYAVASFYSFLSLRPKGRHVIRICRSLPCEMKNSLDMKGFIEREVGIMPGQTTPDGRFSLEITNCLGLCDQAPAMLIDNDPHVSLTPGKILDILELYK